MRQGQRRAIKRISWADAMGQCNSPAMAERHSFDRTCNNIKLIEQQIDALKRLTSKVCGTACLSRLGDWRHRDRHAGALMIRIWYPYASERQRHRVKGRFHRRHGDDLLHQLPLIPSYAALEKACASNAIFALYQEQSSGGIEINARPETSPSECMNSRPLDFPGPRGCVSAREGWVLDGANKLE